MNIEIIDILVARLKDAPVEKHLLEAHQDFLLRTGFRKVGEEGISQDSGVLAINRSMYAVPVVTDVVFLPFSRLEETSEGYCFGPEDTNAIPVNMWYGKWQGNLVSRVDLFVPKHMDPFLYISESLPDYTERDRSELERFEVRKFIRSRENIEAVFPSLCEKLERVTQPLEMQVSEFDEIKSNISDNLDLLGIDHKIIYRSKTVESVFSKAERRLATINSYNDFTYGDLGWLVDKDIPSLEEVALYSPDINGMRVMVKSAEECYKALDVLSQEYKVESVERDDGTLFYRIYDCIPFPKRTGFQMIGYFSEINGKRIHFEIQSEKMQSRAANDGYHLRV
ncbi:hypothetical protein GOV13_03805 [Candidatus Pacearchaeota archaeon]|nr:hypothetical protein [Candidatus Pacearchaeota archaeon]